MQKIVGILVGFMLICFLVINCFTIGVEKLNSLVKVDKIKVLIKETGEIKEMSLDEYLIGVLVGEVPSTYDFEALKAQAVVARTYTLYKIYNSPGAHESADMCDDINHCQAFKTKEYAFDCWDDETEESKWNKLEKAVKETSGEVITYNGEIINAFFHAHSGGMTEDVKYLWGKEEIPYLKSVESEEGYDYDDKVIYSKLDFCNILKEKYPDIDTTTLEYSINEYTPSGRVSILTINNNSILGTEARNLFGLRSTYFSIEENDNEIIFSTKGYGHGIGMSQEGANYMALHGSNYKDIITHYYTGVKIECI